MPGKLWRGALVVFILLFYLQLGYLAGVVWWGWMNPANTAFMEAGLDRLQEKKGPDAELRHQWVDYGRISIHLKRAVIAAEDSKFLEHEGFDWRASKRPSKRI